MGLWDRISGKRSTPAKTTIFVDGRPARSQVIREPESKPTKIDWDAFVTETMATEQSRAKSPAPPPVPRKPLLTRFGDYLRDLAIFVFVVPAVALAIAAVVIAFAMSAGNSATRDSVVSEPIRSRVRPADPPISRPHPAIIKERDPDDPGPRPGKDYIKVSASRDGDGNVTRRSHWRKK